MRLHLLVMATINTVEKQQIRIQMLVESLGFIQNNPSLLCLLLLPFPLLSLHPPSLSSSSPSFPFLPPLPRSPSLTGSHYVALAEL